MITPQRIRIGTRASALALAQSEEVKQRLLAAHPAMRADQIEIVPMKTTGDRIQNMPLNDIGGKGLFTKEIEEALLKGEVDIAVHSMKDMPAQLPPGLVIPCILEREDPRDAFISLKATSVEALPEAAVIGTSSLRRAAQMKHLRPDLHIVPLRGNVQTRLRKLEEGVCDATLLAVAGLKRLGLTRHISHSLSVSQCLPAIAQGAIGVECCEANDIAMDYLQAIHHPSTALCVAAERSLLAALDGSCRTPIGGLAVLEGGTLTLEGLLAQPDGGMLRRRSVTCAANQEAADAAGKELGRLLCQPS